jgi:hypothetical protein
MSALSVPNLCLFEHFGSVWAIQTLEIFCPNGSNGMEIWFKLFAICLNERGFRKSARMTDCNQKLEEFSSISPESNLGASLPCYVAFSM